MAHQSSSEQLTDDNHPHSLLSDFSQSSPSNCGSGDKVNQALQLEKLSFDLDLNNSEAKGMNNAAKQIDDHVSDFPSVSKNDNKSTETTDNDKESHDDDVCYFDRLPMEVIFHIFSFLDIPFVVETLANVSCRFCDLLNDNIFWRTRLRKRWPKKYPAIPGLLFFLNCSID